HIYPIVHGDLSSNNALIDADYTARLADFGCASLVENVPEDLSHLLRSTAQAGTLRWTAPEQILSEDKICRTPKGDIYSFGCMSLLESLAASVLIFLQVLSGKQPWSEVKTDARVIIHLQRGHKPSRPESRPVDDQHWDFIQQCWSSMEERPAAEDIL
ncbi:kinase-like protein, partial [Imleria badia]